MKTTEKYGKRIDRALGMWVKLSRAFSTMNNLAAQNIHEFGLTVPQFGALECLGHLGPMTIGALCRKMLVSGGNMTVVIDNLEKIGLVERIRKPGDRRQIYVQLTAAGYELFGRIFPEHAEFVAGKVSVLTPNEQEKLASLLKKFGRSVELHK